MLTIVTPEEMAAVDAGATEPLEVLIERAGISVAWAARRFLGGTYGRRVVVIAGKGNNGADGRVAARRLQGWGARVQIVDAADPGTVAAADLVIDAAYGTGLSRSYQPPTVQAPVLAVDIASGVNGLTGEVIGGALEAVETVTFQALKPGLLFPPGSGCAGDIFVADLGLDVSGSRAHLIDESDVSSWLPGRPLDSHKWKTACWVIAGSPAMAGAGQLAAAAAARSGAGYVRLSSPGTMGPNAAEVVRHELGSSGWSGCLDDIGRFASLVIGPGLGRHADMRSDVRAALASTSLPAVVDADALVAIGQDLDIVAGRGGATVLTPHDGEFEALTGARPGLDRIQSARALAARARSVVLLKGSATVVAEPGGEVLVSASGDQRLASAGTGDVLAGVIGALMATGSPPFEAAVCGAWLHGKTATSTSRHAMVASDLLTTLPEVIDATHMG